VILRYLPASASAAANPRCRCCGAGSFLPKITVWFRANLSAPAGSGPAEADLIRQSWFIAVREHVVLA